jgi:nucleotide-binding universal stress UspA family protein
MFRSIVVPLDGSRFAEQSLPLALGLAHKAGTTLHLVQVHGLYALRDPAYGWLPYDPALDAKLKEEELAYLDALAMRVAAFCPLATTSTVMSGLVTDGILAHAKANTADLIVMTTHGRGPLSRAFLGSVADELVRRISTPVLVVRPKEVDAAADILDAAHVRQVLIAVDRSALSEQIVEPALLLGRTTGATITLMHALESPRHAVAAAAHEDRAAEEAHAYLETLAQRLRAHSLEVQVRIVRGQHAATAILNESANGYDLVALTTHGHGGIKRLLLGSVADKVVRGAHIPVLVYCPTPG